MDGSLCSYYRVQGHGWLTVVITGYKVMDGSLCSYYRVQGHGWLTV